MVSEVRNDRGAVEKQIQLKKENMVLLDKLRQISEGKQVGY